MNAQDLLEPCRRAVRLALEAGAQEAVASFGIDDSVDLNWREGQLEKSSQSRSRGIGLRLLVDDRYSTHGSSDLRPDFLPGFVKRAVEATRFLEPDADRSLAPREACGVADASLDQVDPSRDATTHEARQHDLSALEAMILAGQDRARFRSCTVFRSDGHRASAQAWSHGFETFEESTGTGLGASLSIEDQGGRVPEVTAWYSACHAAELPDPARIAEEAWTRVLGRLGAGPVPSGRYPLLLENRVAGRMVGMILGPMGGGALHHGKSCLAGKLGSQLFPPGFDLVDEPHLPRAASSTLFDGDGFPTRARKLVEDGRLATFLLGLYHARKLGSDPTTSSTTNLRVKVGHRSPSAFAMALSRAIRVESFLGGNMNSLTGDFSFGIRGTLLEHGEPVRSLAEMNVSGNLFDFCSRFLESADDPWLFGSFRTPTMLFDGIQFSGT